MKDARAVFVADFETTTRPDDCRVWAWGLANLEKPEAVEFGIDLDSFIERIGSENSICYFHNLKFDGHFIIDWLLKHDFEHLEGDDIAPLHFKSLISDTGMFYSVTVKWADGYSTEFRDSLKKLPMSVKRIAKSFELEEGKGDLDYETFRPVGHKLTTQELDYIRRDVQIVAKAMKTVHDSGMTRLTVASDSMAEYKRLVGAKSFLRTFPVLSDDMDSEIRRAYRGGFTYADPRFRGRKVGGGIVLDVNSLYPSVMKTCELPYGIPEFVEGYVDPTFEYPLTIFSVTFTAKLKKDHIPCIQVKGSSIFSATEYLTEIKDPTTLMVTNVDWDLFNDHYDIEVMSYNNGWRFKAISGLFDSYIEKWSKVKEKSVGGKREIAKLHLNSLYGKFASNPNVTGKIPVLENGAVKFVRGKDDTRPPVYTAAGVFITAYARDLTIRAAQSNYPVFAYADTDSLHLLTDKIPESLDVHPTKLGAWKFEYEFDAAYYIRAKAYLERHVDGTYTNRIAGLPEQISRALTFDDLVDGKVLHGKLNPRSVPGGVVLANVPFELKL